MLASLEIFYKSKTGRHGVFGYKRSGDGFEGSVLAEAGAFFFPRVREVHGMVLSLLKTVLCDEVRVSDGCMRGG